MSAALNKNPALTRLSHFKAFGCVNNEDKRPLE